MAIVRTKAKNQPTWGKSQTEKARANARLRDITRGGSSTPIKTKRSKSDAKAKVVAKTTPAISNEVRKPSTDKRAVKTLPTSKWDARYGVNAPVGYIQKDSQGRTVRRTRGGNHYDGYNLVDVYDDKGNVVETFREEKPEVKKRRVKGGYTLTQKLNEK